MKLIICVSFLLLCPLAMAQADIAFGWDYDTPGPSGFELRITSMNNGVPPIIYDCGECANNTCLVPAVAPGVYQAVCLAYNTGIPENLKAYSEPSNSISFTVPEKPATPRALAIESATMTLNISWPAENHLAINMSFGDKE